MGQGCSQAFAMAGYEVRLQSLDDELFRGVRDRIRGDLAFLAERGLGSAGRSRRHPLADHHHHRARRGSRRARISCSSASSRTSRPSATLFRQMEALVAPDVILATNTSVIRISEIAEACSLPGRVVGAHWWNPGLPHPHRRDHPRGEDHRGDGRADHPAHGRGRQAAGATSRRTLPGSSATACFTRSTGRPCTSSSRASPTRRPSTWCSSTGRACASR